MTWWLWVLVGWWAGALVVAGCLGRLLRRRDQGVLEDEPIGPVVWSRDRRLEREPMVSVLSPEP